MRTNVRAQELGRDDFDPSLEELLQKERQTHKVLEGLLARAELYEQIDIAVRPCLASHDGSEQREPLNTEGSDLSLAGQQPGGRCVSGKGGCAHGGNVARRRCTSKFDTRSNDLAFSGEPAVLELCRGSETMDAGSSTETDGARQAYS